MTIPILSKAFKSGFVERGLARPICENFVEDLPKAIFGNVPHTKVRDAAKHLHRTKFTDSLHKHFKFHKKHTLGSTNILRKISLWTNPLQQILTKQQDYIAIPAGLYLGHKIASHFNKPVIKPKSHVQKIMDSALGEIQSYAACAAEKPLLASIGLAGAIYGVNALNNKMKHHQSHQQETIHESL